MLLPAGLLIVLLCLSHMGSAWGFARLLDDVELRSAFSVARTSSMEGGPKMTVTFDAVYVNIGGDFDAKSGLFRCRIPGAYYFSFTVGKFPHKDLSVMLMKNRNEVQAIVYEENAGEERKVRFRASILFVFMYRKLLAAKSYNPVVLYMFSRYYWLGVLHLEDETDLNFYPLVKVGNKHPGISLSSVTERKCTKP